MGFSAPTFAFLDQNVPTRTKFSDNFLTAQNLGGRDNCPYALTPQVAVLMC